MVNYSESDFFFLILFIAFLHTSSGNADITKPSTRRMVIKISIKTINQVIALNYFFKSIDGFWPAHGIGKIWLLKVIVLRAEGKIFHPKFSTK